MIYIQAGLARHLVSDLDPESLTPARVMPATLRAAGQQKLLI